MIDTLEEEAEEDETEDIDIGSLEVRELLPDMSRGSGDWVQDPADPKLESKETSEPELWDRVSEARLLDIKGEEAVRRPVLE